MISGGNFTGEVTRLGTPGNDTLNGTDVGSRFVSGPGTDGLKGGGGADSFHGGAGDDTLQVSTLDFSLADGGTGIDTLKLDGSGPAPGPDDQPKAGRAQ